LNTFLKERLAQALPAAKKAGEAILEVYHGHIDVSYKEDQSPLTVADERAHKIITRLLSEAESPQIPILSEEGKHTPYETRNRWEYFWLVDPLDGTKEFIKRRGEFTVNIAVIHKQKPVAGVLCVPVKGVIYFAADGLGSHRLDDWEIVTGLLGGTGVPPGNGTSLESVLEAAKPLPLYDGMSKNRLTVVGSRSHATEDLERFVEKAKQQYDEVEFISAGSALKFGLVAEGTAQIYPRFGPTMEWDTGAGHCVVEQSGGAVLRLKEKTPLVYNKRDLLNPGFVCSTKHLGNVESLL
jgi:3'(2'), 5'-bisphosphate nucleotidase